MKKHLLFTLCISFVFITLFTTSCSNKEKFKIAFLYPSKTIERFKKESEFFKAYAAKNGVEVIVLDSEVDETLQKNQASKVIEQGVDAIVIIAVNVNTGAAIVREANENNIPVLAYNRMITNCDVDFFVASSNDQLGKAMVDAVIKEKPQGNFVLLGGDKFDKNGLDLQNAINKYLKPHIDNGNVNVIYESFIEQWSDVVAHHEMQKVISLYGTDIDAVISGFDGMSDAVIDVLKKYNLEGKVAITGQDAELRGCRNIVAGYQTMTLYHPLKALAEKAAEIAIDLAKGKNTKEFVNSSEFNGFEDIPTHRVNSIIITKDNIDKELIDTGVYTKDEVYN